MYLNVAHNAEQIPQLSESAVPFLVGIVGT
jgi:hypothetical protein